MTHVRHVSVLPRTIVREVPKDPCEFSYSEAWGFIAGGDSAAALAAFACLSQEYPYDGLASIGYAIANAMVGADESAVVAMRHAATVDPEAFRYVPSDEALDEVLFVLHDHYAEMVEQPAWRVDGLFMMAALRASLDDFSGAHFAVTQGIERGDADESAHTLQEMLSEQLQQQLYGE